MPDGRARIVLQFNEYDFRHRKVLEVINSQPRHKTELVVNAVMHFISCPNAGQDFDKGTIRSVVKEVIEEMIKDGTLSVSAKSDDPTTAPENEVLSELGDMMDAFR